MSGPFSDGGGGMAILRCDSLEEAQDIYRESPIVRSGGATVDVREWNVVWGSAQP
ncbi:YciI family protein [Streptomyces sp. KR55]|uniref:YciI family protein n=1 Tax=Streptomyces sp. KR55 TaxID=3457425 RepID=UPI003FD12F98